MKLGTRASKLALIQAHWAAEKLRPWVSTPIEIIPFSTEGDRDKKTDLRVAPQDFFTQELDRALIAHEIDFAVHSAKDLPNPLPDDLDYFWFGTGEDVCDTVVCREGVPMDTIKIFGSSSERRNAWISNRFPHAEIRPIRGTIEERIAQLDAGDFDAIIVAAAALNRLGLSDRITFKIPLGELAPPDGQGFLAVTFLKGNAALEKLRQAFVSPVIFAGAGPGDPDLMTVEVRRAIEACDVCLYDALGASPCAFMQKGTRAIFVGKRLNAHSYTQNEINAFILQYAREGKKVVRLKGGDPGIFGRLAEEIDTLSEAQIPYRILPGISAFAVASTASNRLLTRRGVSRGFSVLTPRTAERAEFLPLLQEERKLLPRVYYMSAAASNALCTSLLAEGFSEDTPAFAVFNVSFPDEHFIDGTLADLASKIECYRASFDTPPPGLIFVGDTFHPRYLTPKMGVLAHQKILLTCSEDVMPSAIEAVRHFNGTPIPFSMIQVEALPTLQVAVDSLEKFDWVVISSPSVARLFLDAVADVRKIPKLLVCGSGTARVFRDREIQPEKMPPARFGNVAMREVMLETITPRDSVLHLKTQLAGDTLPETLREIGCTFSSCVVAENTPKNNTECPPYDAVFFASGSAVRAFATNFPNAEIRHCVSVVIGPPAARVFSEVYGMAPTLISTEATVPHAIETLAQFYFRESNIC